MLKHLTFVCILHETFVHSCFSTTGASSRYEQIYQFRRIPAKLGTKINVDDDAKAILFNQEIRHSIHIKKIFMQMETDSHAKRQYLETFGYLRPTRTVSDAPTNDVPISSRQLKNAVAKFQKLIGITQSGILDDTTREAMLLKRCARKDIIDETNYIRGKNLLWNKLNLSWNISSFPSSLPKSRTREAFEKMFEVWRTHALFDFIEVGDKNKADIAITFDPASSRWPPDRTNTAIAYATGPILSRISLNNDLNWSYNDDKNQNITDITPVILHTIGHVLGLGHSSSPDSVMYPIFENRKPLRVSESTKMPKLNDMDVVAVRHLYGLSATTTSAKFEATTTAEPELPPSDEDCPKELESATEVHGDTYLFRSGYAWQLRERNLINGAVRIAKLFQRGPPNVNASVTRGDLTVLIHERTLYGYLVDETSGTFSLAEGWPKQLHERVFFFPEAAFPLANGSVVLLSGDVFVTYDLDLNRPLFFGDKNTFFPNLPDGLRSGIPLHPGSDDLYRLFTSDTVYEYDSRIQEIISSESLKTYLICS